MQYRYVFVLAAATVAAQNLSGIPTCATACILSGINAAGCGPNDEGCQCDEPGYGTIEGVVASCIITACAWSDIEQASIVGESKCSAYSYSLTAIASDTTSAAATTSATSTSAAAASSSTSSGPVETGSSSSASTSASVSGSASESSKTSTSGSASASDKATTTSCTGVATTSAAVLTTKKSVASTGIVTSAATNTTTSGLVQVSSGASPKLIAGLGSLFGMAAGVVAAL